MRFEISTAKEGGGARLVIEGELDAVSVAELRGDLEKLVKTRPTVVDVDLSQLRMVDSSGVGALVSLYKRVRAQGGSVVIKGLRDQPLAIFRLLRLDRVMLNQDSRIPPSPPAHKQSKSRH
jgi:anti-sigma B factor antagonist